MKRFFFLAVLTLLVTALPVVSQKRALPAMPQERLIWKPEEKYADSFLSEGVLIRIIRNKGLAVAISCYDFRSYVACEVSVLNETEKRVDVLPENFFLAGYDKDKFDYTFSLPATKLAQRYESRARWGNFFRAFAAGMATTTSSSAVSGDINGTITTTSPNIAAQRNAAIANQRAMENAKREGDTILLDALLANTVFPQQHISGVVYFEHKKFRTGAFVNMIIDGTGYSFGFTDSSDKK
jgi:hypothetical protein